MIDKLLISTDLDRTLIPNGKPPESPNARNFFRKLVSYSDITLAYVTGRDKNLVKQAIAEYELPLPDFVIADVGSSIYQVKNNDWLRLETWDQKIAKDWQNKNQSDIISLFDEVKECRLQEQEKQGLHKLSFYVDLDTNVELLMNTVNTILKEQNLQSNIIWSIDEQANIGLLDILPLSANKRYAIEFLMEKENFSLDNTVFSGDSGNDIDVLVSPIKSILVANANLELKEKVTLQSQQAGWENSLYIAQGKDFELNGNYSAGIIEGIFHYFPKMKTICLEYYQQ